MASDAMASESGYNPGLEEIADRAANRLAELTQQYCGEGRTCGGCKEFKQWCEFRKDRLGKNGRCSACNTCHYKSKRDLRRGILRPAPQRPTTLRCRGKCGRDLPFDDNHFTKQKTGHWGLSLTCKQCEVADRKLRRKLRKEHPKEETHGRCFACNKETHDLVLDHDHDTNAFRGWACRSCNIRLSAPYTSSSSNI